MYGNRGNLPFLKIIFQAPSGPFKYKQTVLEGQHLQNWCLVYYNFEKMYLSIDNIEVYK